MSSLEKAISIAAQAHAGQKDKAGAPYILHPLRLMLRMKTEKAMVAAVMHDVIEDSDWTPERLKDEGFSDEVLAILGCLTRREDETYEEFIARAGQNPIARQVKLADLEDNMNILRIGTLTAKDGERLEKYHRAWRALIGESSPEAD
jgi:(p)ppGpp synthase/HD superfamily hydrolase